MTVGGPRNTLQVATGTRSRPWARAVRTSGDRHDDRGTRRVGQRRLARGGAYTIYEGGWEPARLVLLEFPSRNAWESFNHGAEYEGIKVIRDETSTANMVGVEGLATTER